MSTKTKIVVLRMKELLYTGIFVILGILLLLIILFFASSNDNDTTEETSAHAYIPGIYHTALTFNGMQTDMEIALDADHINSIQLINLEEDIATMYPLLTPTVEALGKQICERQSLENITYDTDHKYTSLIILQAIDSTLEKASTH